MSSGWIALIVAVVILLIALKFVTDMIKIVTRI